MDKAKDYIKALEQGLDINEILKMYQGDDKNYTKKRRTREQRVTHRKIQRESRRINRGVNQGKRAKR